MINYSFGLVWPMLKNGLLLIEKWLLINQRFQRISLDFGLERVQEQVQLF